MHMTRGGTHVDGLRVRGLVPPRVERGDAAREVRAAAVLGRDVRGVLAHAVVDAVDRLDEFLPGRLGETGHAHTHAGRRKTHVVHLQPEEVDLGVVGGELGPLRDDLLAEVPAVGG